MSDCEGEAPRERLRRLVWREVAIWGIAAPVLIGLTPPFPLDQSPGAAIAGVIVEALVIWRITRLVNAIHR